VRSVQSTAPMQDAQPANAAMRTAIAGYDWASTPLGPPDTWPAALRTVVGVVLDNAFAMLIMWGPELVQLYNDGYVPIFGDKHPRSLGQRAAQCWADIWNDVGPLLLGVYERGEPVYFENLLLPMQRHGRYEDAYFTFSYSPVRDGDAVAGILCTVSETTAHVMRERDLAERAAALAEIDRAKTEFFNNVSHEFRTPLTLMLGPLEELTRTLPEYEQRRTADLARRNALRLQKLVNTILDYSMAQSGLAKTHREQVDIDALTADLASEFRSAYERAGLRLEVRCEAGRDVAIDRTMYEKVVLNLLSNALKFTFEGGVTVSTAIEADEAVLRVADTGIGIAEDDVARLFRRFSRVRGARSRTHEGSGIGLALVHELVALHGGRIGVQSVVGRGTTFTVRFPAALDAAVEQPARTDTRGLRLQFREEAEAIANPDDLAPATHATDEMPRVLVADDNADLRAYLRRVLGERFTVSLAANGAELVERAETELPALIIADVMMPVMDGFTALERLRANPETASIPVVLLSARAGEDASVEGLARGADDYIVKPFVAADLVARVEALLRRSGGRTVSHDAGRAEREARLLASATDRFIVAADTAAVWETLTSTLTPEFADWSLVFVPDENGRIHGTAIRHREPAKQQLAEILDREFPYAVGDGSSAGRVLQTSESLLFPAVGEAEIAKSARNERHAAILRALELRSAVVVPVNAGGVTVAALSVVRSENPAPYDDGDLAFLERLASRAALAYQSAGAHERQRTIASTLQRALLPGALPSVPGLRFTASYRPAAQEHLVGGDWYDAFVTEGGRVIVSIGDVVGHGLEAATVMSSLRQSIRGLVLEERDPGAILTALNRVVIAERPGALATACIASIDPQTLEGCVASAGHYGAIRVPVDGETGVVGADGLILGVDGDARYETREFALDPGDLLAFYTDGYVELDRDIAAGERRLMDALRRRRDSDDPAGAVHLDVFGAVEPRDDAALLTVLASPVLAAVNLHVEATPVAGRSVRTALRRFLAGTALSEEQRFGLLVAAGEAIINAIEHAYAGEEVGTIAIDAQNDGGEVVVEISDRGGWSSETTARTQRGYGLPLMHAFADAVEIERTAAGTRVRLTARAQPVPLCS
jgi:signal transduction histidine kinase/DNA-binding response OmpR family regulator/anti-sigma regulatory factor (Ser/Thr protein kinase)